MAVAGLLYWATHGFRGARRDLALGLFWPIGYGVAFVVVSFFGLDFKNSVRFHVLYQPLLHAIPFLTWFTVACYFSIRNVLQALLVAALAMAMHAFMRMLFNPDITRFLSNPSVPFGIAGGSINAALCGSATANAAALAVLLVAVWLCLKKTVLTCGIVALLIPFLGYGAFRAHRKRLVVCLAIAALSIAALGLYVIALNRDMDDADASPQTTIERFAERDPTRVALDRVATEMLAQSFPHGIGYMSFMKACVDHINYSTFTAYGEFLLGVSLHNTFMHIVLEGGWLIMLIAAAMAVIYLQVIWQHFKAGNREVFLALVTWTAIATLFGWFQQLHQTDYMFELLGFALGSAVRTARLRRVASNRWRTPFGRKHLVHRIAHVIAAGTRADPDEPAAARRSQPQAP